MTAQIHPLVVGIVADILRDHQMLEDQSCTCGWEGVAGDRFSVHVARHLHRRGLLVNVLGVGVEDTLD